MSRKGFRNRSSDDLAPRLVGEGRPLDPKGKKIFRGNYQCTCQRCKKEMRVSAKTIHRWFDGDPSRYVCYPCKDKNRQEGHDAALALARRRVEQKRKAEEEKQIAAMAAKLERKIERLR